MTDVRWMTLSRDRGTAAQRVDRDCGIVCDLANTVYPDRIVAGTS